MTQPLYRRVKAHVLELIESGRLKAESRIPSENELVQELNVSRMTVNRALRELVREGRLLRVQGVGTFVAPEKPQSALLEIVSIAEEIRRRGGVHSSRVRLLQAEPAPSAVAKEMQLPVGAKLFHAVLLHLDRGTPVQLADRWVNPAAAPHFLEQDYTRITPSAYLIGVAPLSSVEHVIEAVLPDSETRRMLEIDARTPCLLLHRTTWSGGRVATRSRFFYPGTRYRLAGRFSPDGDGRRSLA